MREDGSALLRGANLRVTGPRVAVLEVLAERKHLTAESIMQALRDRSSVVSHQAVYDVLAALVGAGLIRRIEPAGSPALFERRVADNHHHIVCRSCGAVEDVDCAVGSRPCLRPSSTHGFVVDEAEVTYWGLCPDCSTAQGS